MKNKKISKKKAEKIVEKVIPEVPPHKPFCVNCHFLCHRGLAPHDIYEVNRDQRTLMSFNNPDWLSTHYLACYLGEWNENHDPELIESRIENLFRKKRKWKCYFYKYKPEIEFERAKIILDKSKNKLYKNWILFVAIAALIVSVISLIKSCK